MDETIERIRNYLKFAVVAIILIILLPETIYLVHEGERAVLLTWGKASPEEKTQGIHFKVPIVQSAVKMDVKTQKYETDSSAASKDLQVVTTRIAINYHLRPEGVVGLYSELGQHYQARIVEPSVQEVVKASTAKYTAEELITKRTQVKDDILLSLSERLGQRGMVVEEISITNFDFSESFNRAIEEKVTAEQLKLKAERDLERIRIEAEQKVASAQAEAEALRLQKEQVSPELVRLREIDVMREAILKWDGKLPQVTGGAMPFIDVTRQS